VPATLRLRLARRLAGARALVALALGLAVLAGPGAQEAAAQGFGRNKVRYERFDWHVLRTDHFDVYYYPEMEALAEHGAAFAEEQYAELEGRFDFSLTERVPLIFYATNLHFRQTNTTPGFIPDGVGGFFEFLKGRVVIPANGNIHQFRRVIRHELVHVFTFNRLARVLRDHRKPVERVLPLWFTEGLAEYWSGAPDHQHEMILRDAVASNSLLPLADLDRIYGSFTMYKFGEAFCRFVGEEYGDEALLALIDNAWRGHDMREAVEVVLQEDFQALSQRWFAWVRAQYVPDLPDAEPPALASDALAARGFNFKPVVHTRPDGAREVVFVSNRGGYTNVYAQPVDAAWRPTARPEVLVRGERDAQYESFHLFESRMDVSPGGLLAFVTKRGGQDVVHVYDLRARRAVATYGFEDLVAVYSPTWSPDGRRLAFTGIARSGFSDLYVYDRDADRLTALTNDAYDDRDPAWSPDGSTVAFASDRTALGRDGTSNLFTLDLASGAVAYLTYGAGRDLSPRWSPDGRRVVFISSRPEPSGRLSAQDLWTVDLDAPVTASADAEPTPGGGPEPDAADPGADSTAAPAAPLMRRLTQFTSAAFDPVWTPDGRLVFAVFENYRFTVRHLDADSLVANPRETHEVRPAPAAAPWAWARHAVTDPTRRTPYRRRYQLDIAQGGFSTSPNSLVGTGGGAVLAFSDLLGDDIYYVTAYSSNTLGRSFLEGLNVGVTRIHLGRRASYGYGLFRQAGQRYDRADPDAVSEYPVYYEQIYGGVGLVSYPISMFQRVDVLTSLGWSRKDQIVGIETDLETVQLSNAVALVHDNALYGPNGPADGWRANLTAGYTTDLMNSYVSYYTLSADVRRYWRLPLASTFASWGLVRTNVGRRARLNLLGGSWSLRGYRFLRMRGKSLWFTSHELRFPLVIAPGAFLPFLEPFAISSLRGAAFVDAAHPWNEGYDEVIEDPGSGYDIGRTHYSTGVGLRVNALGGFVFRYDIGWRFPEGLAWDRREPFQQFFFGWDF
jgi:hypothetical protein